MLSLKTNESWELFQMLTLDLFDWYNIVKKLILTNYQLLLRSDLQLCTGINKYSAINNIGIWHIIWFI